MSFLRLCVFALNVFQKLSFKNKTMQIKTYQFTELDIHLLYAILKLRSDIFVVEQTSIYLDADDKDQESLHVCGFVNDELVAYTRVMPVGLSYPTYSSIGRVVVAKHARGAALGKLIMQESIALCQQNYNAKIKISAQQYLLKFYTSLGFDAIGEGYMEDGIPHLGMVRNVESE
jgi:ElaA protein